MTSKMLLALAVGAVVSVCAAGTTQAQSLALDSMVQSPARLIYVADGCGPGRYRGPGGACHRFGYGPYPGGYYTQRPRHWNPCPPGYHLGRGGRRCWPN